MLFSIFRFIGEVILKAILEFLIVLFGYFRFIREMISNLFILLFCSIALLGALFVLESAFLGSSRHPEWKKPCFTCILINYLLKIIKLKWSEFKFYIENSNIVDNLLGILQLKWLEFKSYIKNLDLKSIFNSKKNPVEGDSFLKKEFIVDKDDLPLYFINSINEVNIMDHIYF